MSELRRTVGRCLAVVERDISRKVDWKSRVDCMASSVPGHLKEYVHAVPPRIIEVVVATHQATVTAVDANMLWRVGKNSVCLEMD
jgi:hypothetical protein